MFFVCFFLLIFYVFYCRWNFCIKNFMKWVPLRTKQYRPLMAWMNLNLEEKSKLLFESMDAASWSGNKHFANSSLWRVAFYHATSDDLLTVATVLSCAKLCNGSMSQSNKVSENSNFHVENLKYSNGTDFIWKILFLYSLKSQWKFKFQKIHLAAV